MECFLYRYRGHSFLFAKKRYITHKNKIKKEHFVSFLEKSIDKTKKS